MSLRLLLKRSSSTLTTYIRPPSHLHNIKLFSSLSASSNHILPSTNSDIHIPLNLPMRHEDSLYEGQRTTSNINKRITMVPNSPWAVIDVDQSAKLLFFVSDKIFHPVRTPVPYEENVTRCLGSSFGWLIMGDTMSWEASFRLFLFNPSTQQHIQLPPFTGFQERFHYAKVILSSNPNDNDRVVVALKDNSNRVSFCRLGDKAWTVANRYSAPFSDIIFYKGVLYGVCNHGAIQLYRDCFKMFTFDFTEDGKIEKIPFPLEINTTPKWEELNYFLVESEVEGEVLFVIKHSVKGTRKSLYHANNDPYYEGSFPDSFPCYKSVLEAFRFDVFKLDFAKRSWVELASLGDRMLILDRACSMSFDAAKFSQFGFKRNCIYCTNMGYFDDYGWQEFCLEDGKIVPFGDDFSTILPIPPLSN